MNKAGRSKCPAALTPIVCYIVWGLLPIYWRGLQHIPAEQIVCQRILWSCLALAALLVITKKINTLPPVLKNKKNVLILALCAFLLSATWWLFISIVNSGQLLQASLGVYLYPLFTMALCMLLLHDRVSAARFSAAILAVAAVFCQFGAGNGPPWAAALLALCAAAHSLLRATLKIDLLTVFFAETLLAAPTAACFLFYWHSSETPLLAGGEYLDYMLLAGSGLFTAIPLAFMLQAVQLMNTTSLNLLQLIAPSLTLLLGALVFRENLTLGLCASFVLVWTGLALYNMDNISRCNILGKLRKLPDTRRPYEKN
jgi:chloramphenicol-sensitive protein RarD